jgi:hypothetical protein
MRKNYSNWREDLREVVDIPSSEPETEAKSEVKIGDKKVNNKIVINPTMKEAFGEIGALVLEVTELEEEEVDPEKKKQLNAKEQMMRKQQMLSRQRMQMQKQGRLPMGHNEGLDMKKADMGEVKEVQERTLTPGEKEEKEDIVKGMKKDKGGFEKRYGKDAKSVMYATATKLAKEEMSVKDQMKASAEYWKKNPRKDYKAGDGYARNVRDAARNAARKPKDTRTSQQRMNDAVGKSRPGESD